MKTLKSKLYLVSVMATLIFVAMFGYVSQAYQSAVQTEREHQSFNDLVHSVYELDLLANDYLLLGNSQSYIQWQIQHESIGQEINRVSEYVEPATKERLLYVRENFDA